MEIILIHHCNLDTQLHKLTATCGTFFSEFEFLSSSNLNVVVQVTCEAERERYYLTSMCRPYLKTLNLPSSKLEPEYFPGPSALAMQGHPKVVGTC